MRKLYSLLLITVFIVGAATGCGTADNPAQNDNTEISIDLGNSATIDNVINTTFEAPAVNMEVKQLITIHVLSINTGVLSREVKELKPITYTAIGTTINKNLGTATKHTTKPNKGYEPEFLYRC